jgi:hypothetical protein
MDLYLQFGWGMMGLSRDLFEGWGGGTAILSPRDLAAERMTSLSVDLRNRGGSVLLDPQFYLPRADHDRLTSHEYWPSDYETDGFDDACRHTMMEKLSELNSRLRTTHLIVPGERADAVDDHWLQSQDAFLAKAENATDLPLIVTICLSSDAIRSCEQIGLVMAQAESASVSGYYVVSERPRGSYLVDDPVWLANLLDLAAGLRRLSSIVIVGYSNQQQLIMACAGVTAIASGTSMNVRAFSTVRFRASKDKVPYRATWYYCPQALSEYRLRVLDIGVRGGLKAQLAPDPSTPYAVPLFAAPRPSASGWDQAAASRHYLTALRIQAKAASRASFQETVAQHRALLDRAGPILERFQQNRVRGQARDFRHALDTNLAALAVLENTHGPMLRRTWPPARSAS